MMIQFLSSTPIGVHVSVNFNVIKSIHFDNIKRTHTYIVRKLFIFYGDVIVFNVTTQEQEKNSYKNIVMFIEK